MLSQPIPPRPRTPPGNKGFIRHFKGNQYWLGPIVGNKNATVSSGSQADH